VRALAAAIAADIIRRADELGRKENLRVELEGGATASSTASLVLGAPAEQPIRTEFNGANVITFPGVRR
jgi:hypothetical protein